MRVVDSHPAEYRECLDKVLVVLRERQIVEFVDQLNDTDYLAGGIFDGHAENRAMLEAGAVVHHRVESQVFISVRYVNGLKITFTSSRALMHSREGLRAEDARYKPNNTHFTGRRYVTRDADINGKSTLERTEKRRVLC